MYSFRSSYCETRFMLTKGAKAKVSNQTHNNEFMFDWFENDGEQ